MENVCERADLIIGGKRVIKEKINIATGLRLPLLILDDRAVLRKHE